MPRSLLALAMTRPVTTELDVIGMGCWSGRFANWQEFRNGITTGQWSEGVPLKPSIIPARELRRAPHSVKMAVEVMGQACEMAGMEPSDPAVVFSSAMGDMQITDAMCNVLADQPELVSPTRFHNSVHNAAIGYWSIATGSHQPSTAVAGHDHSGALGLLEACVQCCEDQVPVMFVSQEGAAPETLHAIRPSDHPLALALLLVPVDTRNGSLARLGFNLVDDIAATGASDNESTITWPLDFAGNPTSLLLPFFRIVAEVIAGTDPLKNHCLLSINEHTSLQIRITAPGPTSAVSR